MESWETLPDVKSDSSWEALPDVSPGTSWEALPDVAAPQAEQDELAPLPVSAPTPQAPGFMDKALLAGKSFATEYGKAASATDLINPVGGALNSIQALKTSVIDPYILKPAQDYAYSAWNKATRAGEGMTPENEFIHRNLGRLVMGEQAANEMNPDRQTKAINAIGERWKRVREAAKKHGGSMALGEDNGVLGEDVATAYAQAGLQGLADLPIYLINPSIGAEAKGLWNIAAKTSVEGGVAGFASALLTPGADVKRDTLVGGALGLGLGALGGKLKGRGGGGGDGRGGGGGDGRGGGATPEKPQIVGVVHPEHVQELADKLAQKPAGVVEHEIAQVVDVAPDGTPEVKSVGNDASGNMVQMKTAPGTPRRRALKSSAAKESPAVSEWEAALDASTKDTSDVRRIRQLVENEQYAVGPSGQITERETGKVLVDVGGALELRDIQDPVVRFAAFERRGLMEFTAPDGTTKVAHVQIPQPDKFGAGGGQALAIPIEGHPNTVAEPMLVTMEQIKRIRSGDEQLLGHISDKELKEIGLEAYNNQPTEFEAVTAEPAQLPGGVGRPPPREPPLPPAPPPNGLPPGGAPPPPPPEGIKPSTGLALTMRERLGAEAYEKMRDSLVPAFQRGDEMLGQMVMAEQTAKAGGMNNEQFYYNHLQRDLKIKDPARAREAQKAFGDLMDGFKTQEQLFKEFPEFEIRQQQFIRSVVNEAKRRAHELAEHGVIEEPIDLADLGNHAWRGYMKRLLPKGLWARIAKRNEKLKAAFRKQVIAEMTDPSMEYAAKEVLADKLIDVVVGDPRYDNQKGFAGLGAKGKVLKPRADLRPGVDRILEEFGNDPKLRAEMQEVIKARLDKTADVKPALEKLNERLKKNPNNTSLNFNKAIDKLAQQDELTYLFRQMLGETDLGYFRMARTFAQQDRLLSSLKVWERMTIDGAAEGIFSPGELHPDGQKVDTNLFTKLENDPRRFGKAAGGWLRNDVHKSLVTLTDETVHAAGWVQKLMGAVRWGMTVGALHTGLISNTLYNVPGAILAGGFNPMSRTPKGMYDALADTIRAGYAFHKAPLAFDNPEVRMFKRMQELGIVGSGFGRKALRMEENRFRTELLQELNAQGSLDMLDVFKLQVRKLGQAGMRANNLAAFVYDLQDPLMKGASWFGQLDQAGNDWRRGLLDRKKAAKFLGPQYNEAFSNKTIAELTESEAARRVALSFPMHNMLAPGIQAMGRSSGILTDTFSTSTAEDGRVFASIPGRLMSNEPNFRWNVLKAAGVSAALYGGAMAMQAGNGVDHEEVNHAFARLPESQQSYRPLAFTLGGRDDRGELKFYDIFSNMFFPALFAKGDPQLSIYINALLAPMKILTGDSAIAGSAVKVGLEQMGLGDSMPDPRVKADQHNAAALVDRLIQKGYGPQAVQRTYNYLKEGNMLGQQQSPLSPQYDFVTATQRFLSGGRVMSPLTREQVMKIDRIKHGAEIKDIRAIRASRDVNSGGPAEFLRDRLFGKEPTAEKKQRLRSEAREKDDERRRKQGLR